MPLFLLRLMPSRQLRLSSLLAFSFRLSLHIAYFDFRFDAAADFRYIIDVFADTPRCRAEAAISFRVFSRLAARCRR